MNYIYMIKGGSKNEFIFLKSPIYDMVNQYKHMHFNGMRKKNSFML